MRLASVPAPAAIPRTRSAPARVAVVVALAWGALAFGAPYPWAAWPLMVVCVTACLLAWIADRTTIALAPVVALVGLVAALALQLFQIPAALLATISPHTAEAVAKFNGTFNPAFDPHTISILPEATARIRRPCE